MGTHTFRSLLRLQLSKPPNPSLCTSSLFSLLFWQLSPLKATQLHTTQDMLDTVVFMDMALQVLVMLAMEVMVMEDMLPQLTQDMPLPLLPLPPLLPPQ